MLLKDGKLYQFWDFEGEEELEKLVNEHAAAVFGQSCEYFNIKKKTISEAGIASIPDGYLVIFEDGQARWYIVEIELSSHPIYEHVVTQASKFRAGLRNLENRKKLVDLLYGEIKTEPARRDRFRDKLGDKEIYHFLNELLSNDPSLLIVVDSRTKELEEALATLRLETDIIEFRTFVCNNLLSDHIHQFDPLYDTEATSIPEVSEPGIVTVTLGGKPVRISRQDILKAAADPEIENFFFINYFVDLEGRKLPAKGLLSLATGISITEFNSPRARRILQKLGFTIRQI